MTRRPAQFRGELAALLNSYSVENESGTPDWVLADYLIDCLDVWNTGVKSRDKWWGFKPRLGDEIPAVDP